MLHSHFLTLYRDTDESDRSSDIGGVISATSNMAYEMTTLPGGGGAVDDHEYEVIGKGGGNIGGPITQSAAPEEMYEIPASDTQHPPPPPSLPDATPTAGNVGMVSDESK